MYHGRLSLSATRSAPDSIDSAAMSRDCTIKTLQIHYPALNDVHV